MKTNSKGKIARNWLLGSQSLNQHLRSLSSKGFWSQVFKEYISYQFDSVFKPSYFGTICWTPFLFEFNEAVKETSHFKNKFLTALCDCKLYQIPHLPDRPRIIFFHETKETLVNPTSSNPKYKRALHTHFHLEGSDKIPDVHYLNMLIQAKVRPGFDRLKRRDTALHKAIVIQDWIRDFHADYNLKDFCSNRYRQDGDLVIDYKNSDLG
ncbi:hypothetical protein [Vulcanococcus sp. Clear-D1]|uniref:hypothetical protein n=1 Tax=Vulcanococcus sp. Clear-D1 TaxID=2766970 RepID=UPI0019A04174|nr:hypothetical protein [Vulcanococcus sp. Clear-D1]MBD1193119.1 hypothetical protein [Vulcanococcus sp. Clear-D1]